VPEGLRGEYLQNELVLKVETANPLRSFKGRGCDWLVTQLAQEERLICASAGNFGQAMAYACRKKGIPLTVYASTRASPLKLERMQAMGAGRKSLAPFLILPERVFRKIHPF
jgi:threonine dehydratase